jgi:hypothetical protein
MSTCHWVMSTTNRTNFRINTFVSFGFIELTDKHTQRHITYLLAEVMTPKNRTSLVRALKVHLHTTINRADSALVK